MKTRLFLLFGLLGWGLLALLTVSSTLGQDSLICRLTFLAYNAKEELPNQPIIRGDLLLELSVTGEVSGELLAPRSTDPDADPNAEQPVLASVVGQHNGRAINLVFESLAIRFGETLVLPTNDEAVTYPTGLPLFATGTSVAEVGLCTGMWGGTYVTADPITGGQWFGVAP
jgi:hypothetical protein